ncbi:J domain-containing protein [Luteitalea sp.]|uniref:J domain-containing protein n=1 Tax=Luteitalea sp. TaxID=2004800 RepID=UPI0025BBAEC0|nr:J domain-containing protein [Luteitalea sp.]
MEDHDGIRELRAVLESEKDLRDWMPEVEQAEMDVQLVPPLMAATRENPGVLLSAVQAALPGEHRTRISKLAARLEKGRRIYRVKSNSTYRLYPAGYVIQDVTTAGAAPHPPTTSPPQTVLVPQQRHSPISRTPRAAAKARLLDFSTLPVMRLPMAPARWSERADQAQSGKPAKTQPTFIVEGEGWTVAAQEKLAPADRPNLAFKEVFPTSRYTYWLDPKGKRDGFEHAASVLRVTDAEGAEVSTGGLAHDVYRADVNGDGSGILFLSREGILHGYTPTLNQFLEERLLDQPEYQAQARRLGIEPRELKNHTRSVALSADRRKYLITIVDEAWCLDTATGAVIWGLRLPTKEGWSRRVAARSERTGTSVEVEAALSLMELELPVTPDAIVRQYRALAMRWHPDRNPHDPTATARFRELHGAMQLLTGTDLASLGADDAEHITYEQVLSATRVSLPDDHGGPLDVTLTMSMVVGESQAADWIYASNLGNDGGAFVAGYSGKVVVISPGGTPERVYDIGAVPRHVVDASSHVYIVTDTRLYVLSGDRLEALVDVAGATDIVVGDTGFALLEPKAMTWFTPSGKRVGAVRTKDPLRRVSSTSAGVVVETRQHRATIAGAPSWWA